MTELDALSDARAAIQAVEEAKQALRQAEHDRDDAIRVTAAVNPDLPVAALANWG